MGFLKSLWIGACLFIAITGYAQSDATRVKIQSGWITGVSTTDKKINSYKGIPFAAPPIGALRWKAPQPVKPWQGVRACTAFGPSPMQTKPVPFSMWSAEFLIPKEPISEDCLYLNVWAGNDKNAKKPVLVWIYGGGFSSGGSAVPIYDGEAMARKGIVFVSINYRVGIFGFLAHPELTKESGINASGNYGLLDQIAALKWVQQNIAAFGGDPKNVTIAGQSAGSMSVNALVASPLAAQLFQKAIGESGAMLTQPLATLAQAEEAGTKTAAALKAASLAHLRAMPADSLLKHSGMSRPIADGYVLPQSIMAIFNEGRQNGVALLTGWNEEEGLLFGPVKNATAFKEDLQKQYGDAADSLLQWYKADDDATAKTAQFNLSRDLIFGVQNYRWAKRQSASGLPVYVYRFTRKVPGTGAYAKYGAFHTGEVPYAYDNLKFVDRPWQPADHQLAQVLSGYFANFIKTGDPNGKGLPQWPRFEAAQPQVMQLDTVQKAVPMPDAAALDYLEKTLLRKAD